MHTRRLVAFLLGVWLGGMLLVAYTINANSSTTRNILENAGEAPRRAIDLAGRERANILLNYNTAEIGRALTETWEWLQLGIGIAVLATLPFAMRLKWGYLIAAGLMVLIVLSQRIFLTPDMIGVGRMLDMAGGNAWTQDELWKQRRTLYTLQQLYWTAEGTKATIGLGLTAALLIFRRKSALKSARSSSSVRRDENSDRVNDSNYSHVDR